MSTGAADGHPPDPQIVIVGSGFAGLGMAIRLRQAGITDFMILERASTVGGTWRDNSYPGAACDIPSVLYSFSFAPNSRWTHSFSPQPEIHSYLERCADRYDIRRHIRFDCALTHARWDPDRQRWVLATERGEVTADILISASGALSDPAVPELAGIEQFTGTSFHSARWDHDHDLSRDRVAVIGTGSSAAQFVPRIAPNVAQLNIFQRHAPWVMPRLDRRLSRVEHSLFRAFPPARQLARLGIYWGREVYALGFTVNKGILEAASRLARMHMEHQVADPELRRKLVPDYSMGCKRVILSSDYYPTLNRDNVDLVTEPISEVRARSIVTSDGRERPIDTIIYGTGFRATDPPIAHLLHRPDGQSLAAAWQGSQHAYLGTAIPGFPNLFLLTGPNTGLGHSSQLFMIESQISYVLAAITTMRAAGLGALEVDPGIERAYTDALHRRMERTVWLSGGCDSWYLDRTGKNTTLWPTATFRFRSRTRKFDLSDYRTEPERRDARRRGPIPVGI